MKLIRLDKRTWVGCGDLMAQPSHGQNLCGVAPAWRHSLNVSVNGALVQKPRGRTESPDLGERQNTTVQTEQLD